MKKSQINKSSEYHGTRGKKKVHAYLDVGWNLVNTPRILVADDLFKEGIIGINIAPSFKSNFEFSIVV